VPSQAIDGDGTLCTRYLYGDASEGCMLLYTAVDAPSGMKLLGTLKADDPVFLWVNGEPIISAGEPGADAMEAAIELRKGPNSILIACCWDHAPGCIAFELSEESGLPPTGLGNDLGAIVDGYERLSANEPDVKKETSRQAELQEIVITYYNPEAREVSVIGSFNNWEVGATQMKRAGKGNWTARIALRAGKYPYKLVVNRKMKIADPANNVTEPDGFGGFNSVLQVH
jgi:hypothetical protein